MDLSIRAGEKMHKRCIGEEKYPAWICNLWNAWRRMKA